MQPRVFAKDRAAWRRWLSRHHGTADQAWLVYYKKHTGKTSIAYLDSVEEALCFGWIDGLKRRIDDDTYTHRFTPRRPGSRWSPQNIGLAEKLIEQKKMTRAGLAAFANRRHYDGTVLKARAAKVIGPTPELEAALKRNRKAWKNFQALTPGYRKQYVTWLLSAKREETRQRRLQEAIRLLAANRKLGMK